MYESLRVGVAVPAYRAVGHVGEVLKRIPGIVDHVVVVDDASGDGTGAEVLGVAAVDPRSAPARPREQRGRGRRDVDRLSRPGRALGVDLLVKLDADGQMDPADIPCLLEPMVHAATAATRRGTDSTIAAHSGPCRGPASSATSRSPS